MQHTFFLISKKLLYTFFCTFLCSCFARLQRERNFQKLPSYTLYGGNAVCVPVHFFFAAAVIFTLVAASISPFSHRRHKNVCVFLPTKLVSFVFISRSSCLSVIHVNVDIEINSKERIGFCCCCFYLEKAGNRS